MYDYSDEIPEVIAAWLAGLIDGEGSIMMTSHPFSSAAIAKAPSLAKRRRYRIHVSVYNTDKRLMDVICSRTGIHTVYAHTRQPKENHKKTSYRWEMNATNCRIWLPRLIRWLVVKKEQAELALEVLAINQSNASRLGVQGKTSPMDDTRREDIQMRFKQLNRKGRESFTVNEEAAD